MTEFVQVNPATATTGALVAVDFITLGTATDVALQRVKVGFGTDSAFTDTATNAPFPVVLELTRQTIDSAAGATDFGLVFLVKRQDTPAELVATDGDYTSLRTASDGLLWTQVGRWTATGSVNIVAATGSISVIQPTASNLNVAVSSAATLAVDTEMLAAVGILDDIATATAPLVGALAMGFATTATGLLSWHRLRSATTGNLLVNVPGTVNIAAATGTITVIQGTAANLNVAMSSAATIAVSVATAPVFNVQQMSTATSPVSVGTWTATGAVFIDNKATATIFVSVQNTATILGNIGGKWAHDATSTGNPIYLAGISETTFPTGVSADGDVTQIITDPHGRLITMPFGGRLSRFQYFLTVSATTVATLATAAGTAGVFRDLVSFVAFNSATIEGRLRVRSSTTSTEMYLNLAADGGGVMFNPSVPWPQAVAATVWDLRLDGITTGGEISIGALFLETT